MKTILVALSGSAQINVEDGEDIYDVMHRLNKSIVKNNVEVEDWDLDIEVLDD